MYGHGGLGSTHLGERFTFEYDLPNDIAYAETCASIGLIYFADEMFNYENNGEYIDVTLHDPISTRKYPILLGHGFLKMNNRTQYIDAKQCKGLTVDKLERLS